MRYSIVVNETDIKAGKRGNPYWCPVALAVSRELGPAALGDDSGPTGSTGSIFLNDKWRKVIVSQNTLAWMKRFDYHGPESVEPFAAELEVL